MRVRCWILWVFIATGNMVTESICGMEASTARPPNIVLLYADNLGYGDLGCYGNSEVKTPHIDRLAEQGVRCTDFYVVAPSCTPSRGAILTGRYPLRNGLSHQLATTENWNGIGLPHREKILPQYLQEAGYATACFGKWNIGFADGSRPTERGFDEFLGFRSGNIHYFKHTYHGEYDMFRGTERYPVEGYSTEIFAEAASEYIRRARKEKPFFLYVPWNAPHYVSSINTEPEEKPEWHVPGRYLAKYGWPEGDSTEQHRYWALLTAMDEGIGKILKSLEESQQSEQTLVIFLSDMGAILRPTHGLGVASNRPYRDGAPSVYEGGIRVPAIVRWPGQIAPGTLSSAVLSQLDILPLCLRTAGIQPPRDRLLDGHDPMPGLTGKGSFTNERLFFHYAKAFALRDGSLKIVRNGPEREWELYDLANDPGETKDLALERPDDLKRLVTQFDPWLAEFHRDASPPAPRPPLNQMSLWSDAP